MFSGVGSVFWGGQLTASGGQGAVLAAQGLPPMTPSTGEFDLYASNRNLLRLAGVEVFHFLAANFTTHML